ncbi:histidine kinase [Kitasatospora sp. MAA4]|uniref:sensor histidine kinase n=1 Tax=Kitasatospora sp. MAA4 TaxID=3035093 RepID=UPI0024769CC0|nr:histidine kinase [Kitasatospora sp. MAA4]
MTPVCWAASFVQAAPAAVAVTAAGALGALAHRELVWRRRVEARVVRACADAAATAVAQERLRFARDLHDLVGHSLSAITLKAQLADRLLEPGAQRSGAAGAQLAELMALSRRLLVDVRHAVRGYRRAEVADELAQARAVLTAAGVTPLLPEVLAPLPGHVGDVFAWALREAVTNVLRHSRATRVEITIEQQEGTALMRIHDNGTAARIGSHPQGSGLAGMRERAALAGGRARAARHPRGGFLVEVELPCQVAA